MAKIKAAVKVAEPRGVKSQKPLVEQSTAEPSANKLLLFFDSINPQRAILLLTLACCLAYANSLGGDFVFDDADQIVDNKDIRSWDNLGKAFTTHVWAFRERPEALRTPVPPPYYRPLFTVLFTIEYQLFGLNPQGWHLTSLLLHLLCSLMVYFVLLEFCKRKSVALLAALLFAVYSIHVESVAWVSGVTDPLYSFFLLCALYCQRRFRESGRRVLFVWSLVWFLLATYSKETAFCFLPLVFTLEWLDASQNHKESAGKQTTASQFIARAKSATFVTLPYAGIAVIYLIPRILVLGSFTWHNPHAYQGPAWHTFLTLPWVICTYLLHLVFPINLSVAYFTSFVTSAATLRFLLPTAILSVLICAIIAYRKRFSRQFWYATALFITPLLPVLDLRQLSTEYLISDRYLYLSVAGWAYLLALGIWKLAAKEAQWFAAKTPRPLAMQNLGLAALLTIVAIALLTVATLRENRNWVSPYALWSNAARIRPEFWAMHYNTGLALLAEAKLDNSTQKYEQARDNLLNAVKLPQVEPSAFNALGQAYDALGATEPAIASFKQAIEMDPETFEAVNNLGTIYYKAGNYETAARYFRSALMLKPQVVAARFNLALCYEKQGRFAEVASELTTALRYAAEDAEILDHLGLAYEKLNKRNEAISTLQRALAISQAKNSTELSSNIATNLKRLQTTN